MTQRKERPFVIRVVTIAREYGSGGSEVGRLTAQNLGWKFLDASLINKVAAIARARANIRNENKELCDSWLEQLADGIRLPSSAGCHRSRQLEVIDANSMRALTEHVVRAAADMGDCVIVGRGSQCILRGHRDALHVFVYAPVDCRTERLKRRFPDRPDLRDVMADIDRQRATYVHRHYGYIWDDICMYDLCLNTARGTSTAAATIVEAVDVFSGGTNEKWLPAVPR